jgi:hypothetical protein
MINMFFAAPLPENWDKPSMRKYPATAIQAKPTQKIKKYVIDNEGYWLE